MKTLLKDFAMPLRVNINGKEITIIPREDEQNLVYPDDIKTFEVNRNFYVFAKQFDQ